MLHAIISSYVHIDTHHPSLIPEKRTYINNAAPNQEIPSGHHLYHVMNLNNPTTVFQPGMCRTTTFNNSSKKRSYILE